MRNRGFTLIELLVVIAIISVLAGMATVGMGIASKTKARTKTQALMGQLQADLTTFKTVNGWYPEGPGKTGSTTGTQDWKVIFEVGGQPKDRNSLTDADWTKVANYLVDHLKDMGASYKLDLEDSWKTSLRYRPSLFYPFDTSSTAAAVDSQDPPVKDCYQLWSAGPDRSSRIDFVNNQAVDRSADDLTSWPK